MKEFLASRTKNQWLAAAAWAALIVVVALGDVRLGNYFEASVEAGGYFALFCAAAYIGHLRTKPDDA